MIFESKGIQYALNDSAKYNRKKIEYKNVEEILLNDSNEVSIFNNNEKKKIRSKEEKLREIINIGNALISQGKDTSYYR